MVIPQRAAVVPRVIAPETGTPLRLEDEVLRITETRRAGAIGVIGGSGSGKTTALQHLAEVLPREAAIRILDDPQVFEVGDSSENAIVVFTTLRPVLANGVIATYRLAHWNRDDIIEYLLATAKESCGSVLSRLQFADLRLMRGIPEVCRAVVDCLISDSAVAGAREAMLRIVEAELGKPDQLTRLREACLKQYSQLDLDSTRPSPYQFGPESSRLYALIRHEPFQLVLAAEQFAINLRRRIAENLTRTLSRDIVEVTALAVAGDDAVLKFLRRQLRRKRMPLGTTASLLHAAFPSETPKFLRGSYLFGGFFDGADWPGIRLTDANLDAAEFRYANLNASFLYDATAHRADFQFANLAEASMSGVLATAALFCHADLRRINAPDANFVAAHCRETSFDGATLERASFADATLDGATFVGVDLTSASLIRAKIENTDFTNAIFDRAVLTWLDLRTCVLSGARFHHARMQRCNLEDVELPGARFSSANLTDALLTGSLMPRADFSDADLRNTGLADIEWEGADLCGADLRGASFHAGSSRSGMLFTPYASEGTRTGFYTDDYTERSFKSPEEIRKANLRGADLRGANIADVDFYLVDLRDATNRRDARR